MSKSINYEKLSKRLECGICLCVIYQPKQLVCHHSYCKACLDRILIFAPNGSATIKCPNGCESHTMIAATQTTNDLPINFMLKSVLELALEENPDADTDNVQKCSTCARDATRYCTKSYSFKCQPCTIVHNALEEQAELIPVDCRAREGRGAIVCEEHLTEAEYSCCDAQFVCTYCVNRGKHSEHKYESLSQVEQNTREFLRQKLDSNADYVEARKKVQNQIRYAEGKLEKQLRMRKIKCLLEYMHYLGEEEAKIKEIFKKARKDHQLTFDSMEYFQECTEKSSFHFHLAKSKIAQMTESVYLNDSERIPGTTVRLVDDATDPLGTLKTIHCGLCQGFQFEFLEEEDVPPLVTSAQSLIDNLTKTIEMLDENDDDDSGWVSDEGTTDEVCDLAKPHQCVPKCVPYFLSSEGTQRTMVTSFELHNVTKVHGRICSDPVTFHNFKVSVLFQPVVEEKEKYAGVFVNFDYKGYKPSWSLKCDPVIKLKSLTGKDITSKISEKYEKEHNAWGRRRMIKWDDLLDPNQGILLNDCLKIEVAIDCKIFED